MAVIRRIARAPAPLFLWILLLYQSVVVETKNRYDMQRKMDITAEGNQVIRDLMTNQDPSPRRLVQTEEEVEQKNEPHLHRILRRRRQQRRRRRRRRRRNGRRFRGTNPVFVNGRGQNILISGGGMRRGGGRGGKGKGGKGKGGTGSSKSSKSGRGGSVGSRSRSRGMGMGMRMGMGGMRMRIRSGLDDGANVPPLRNGGGALILVRPVNPQQPAGTGIGRLYRGTGIGRLDRGRGDDLPRPQRPGGIGIGRPYRGTGIGRLDQGRGRDLPRPGRPGGDRFPNRYGRGGSFDSSPAQPNAAAPSVAGPAASPDEAPGSTSAPTVPGATNAPTTMAAASAPTASPNRGLVVYTRFGLTYFTGFATDVDRDLTPAEYEDLARHLDAFYTAAFQADPAFSTDFISYMTDITSMRYMMGGDPNVEVDFDANFEFAPGSSITPNQVFMKMEMDVDYMAFINDYLMTSTPADNQLNRVQAVEFFGSTMPL